jgi:hypothetical protein
MAGRVRSRGDRYELDGTISSAAFASGDRFVIGRWVESPVGPMNDVMWARPDGRRILVVDRPEAGQFITSVYDFDTVEVTPVACAATDDVVEVSGGRIRLVLRLGRQWPIPLARLRRIALFRPVEAALGLCLLGVRTYGVSPTGISEWYRADGYRRIIAAEAWVDDEHLGRLVAFDPPARFGFSEPPRRPAVVRVRPRLDDPTGRLRPVVDSPERAAARTSGRRVVAFRPWRSGGWRR